MIYKKQYDNQRRSAKYRGIEWNFTYDTWITWWGDDIQKRGISKDQLVMARNNDTGPYHPDNVKKITCSVNSIEGNKNKIFSTETRMKISDANKGKASWNKGLTGPDSHMTGNKNAVKYIMVT